MQSLEIRQSMGRYGLYLREYNGVEVERSLLIRLTPEQAHAISGSQTGIPLLHIDPNVDANPLEISIDRVMNREPNTRAWELHAGNQLIGRITDDTVRHLKELATVRFQEGEPNWDTRAIEDIDDSILAARGVVDRLVERREQAMAQMTQSDAIPSM